LGPTNSPCASATAPSSQSTFDRDIYPTAGRSYEGETEDWGISGELDWDFGNVSLTSITAYRDYSNFQGSDTDYTGVDILYRTPGPDAGARAFKTFTADLHRLADWLLACGVTSVAMESTGVYWIPLYEILEARGLDVVLVNAKTAAKPEKDAKGTTKPPEAKPAEPASRPRRTGVAADKPGRRE